MKTKYKICFVSPKAYPIFSPACNSVFGGAEVDLYYLATELAKDQDFEVSCIVADYGQTNGEIIENVRLIKSLTFRENALAGAAKIWQAMRTANADYYMLESASPGVVLAGMFCQLHTKKLVYRTAHTDECDGKWQAGHKILAPFFHRAIRQAHQVIVQNQTDRQALLKTAGIDSIVIANGHRLNTPVTETKREYILWVGRSASFKQPGIFLQLAQSNPTYQFLMICPEATDDKNYQQLRQQAEKISNLKFITSVPFQEIAGYFEKALAFVSTSSGEGFPNTFIQACIAGTPIVSLNVNPDNFLTNHNCGLCVTQPEELTNALKSILANQDQYCIAASNYALEKHDLKKIILEYKNILHAQ